MGGRGSSSASAASGGAAKGEKKTASVNADKHRKYLAGELGTRVTKNEEFMMKTVFPGMNYNKVRRSKSNTYAYATGCPRTASSSTSWFQPATSRCSSHTRCDPCD